MTEIPHNVQNIIGNHYGRWTVIAFSHTHHRASYWVCRCDCGTIRTHQRSALIGKTTLSCGCLRGEQLAARNKTHGKRYTPEYNSWRAMKERCQNPNASKYPLYGGRGIRVCERWQKFDAFYADMGPKPTPRHTIAKWRRRFGISKSIYGVTHLGEPHIRRLQLAVPCKLP